MCWKDVLFNLIVNKSWSFLSQLTPRISKLPLDGAARPVSEDELISSRGLWMVGLCSLELSAAKAPPHRWTGDDVSFITRNTPDNWWHIKIESCQIAPNIKPNKIR